MTDKQQSQPPRLFHRLVVHTPHLEWSEGSEYLSINLEVRFLTKVTGELVEPTKQVQIADDHISLEGGGGGQIEYDGRHIEIVCSGSSPEHAEMSSYAVLGF